MKRKKEQLPLPLPEPEKKKRGPNRTRDPEVTRQHLIDTVGLIVKEEGWRGLGVNKIALRAGVDKKLIYWYFGSYNNLLKVYIKSKDFWNPVFDEFRDRSDLSESDLPDFISRVLEEQFKVFFGDTEMQSLIHWQISDERPLLREISAERELQAQQIADMTDRHFEASQFNFRAILALILGGMYYVVWHARMNKTSVCGLDINEERHRLDLIRSIGQLIELVWQAAEKAKV